MLSRIKKFFTPSNNHDASDTHVNPFFLTDIEQIKPLLKSLENQTVVVSIVDANSDEVYTTKVIEVHEEHQVLVLTALSPESGNIPLLSQNKTLKLITQLNNIHSSIILEHLEPEYRYGKKLFYKVDFPKRIYYPQRRQQPRFTYSDSALIKFIGTSERTQCSASGIVINISQNGLTLLLNIPLASLRKEDLIQNCRLSLPNETVIHFDFLIRYIDSYSEQKLIIGGSMQLISENSALQTQREQQQLTEFIQQLNSLK